MPNTATVETEAPISLAALPGDESLSLYIVSTNGVETGIASPREIRQLVRDEIYSADMLFARVVGIA